MHEHHPVGPERATTPSQDLAPADTLFVRLQHQTALLAAAAALRAASPPRWADLLHDYAVASGRVVPVIVDADPASSDWLTPRGVVALLVTEECEDDAAVEHVAAALAAMNAVTLTVHGERAERLRPVIDVLSRMMPDAFAELPVDPEAHYHPASAAAVLTPDTLYRSWAPAQPLALPAHDEDERVALLAAYGRVQRREV